jgi:acetylxylan esterase
MSIRNLLAAVILAANTFAALISVSDFGANPTKLSLQLYVPSKIASKPAIILAVSVKKGGSRKGASTNDR